LFERTLNLAVLYAFQSMSNRIGPPKLWKLLPLMDGD
jgi:hypothetical protein